MLVPSMGRCGTPLTIRGCGQPGGLEDGRHDVDDVVPLAAQLALALDPVRPVDDHGVAGAAVVGGHLLGPGEGRVEADRPAGRHVRIGGRVAPRVVVLQHEVDVRALGHGVEVGHLVVEPDHAALGAGAVVAGDVEDERVVELAHVLDRLDDPARFVVGHLEEGGEDLGLAREELLLLGREVLPVLDVVGLGRQLGVGRESRRASSAARRSARGSRPSPRRTCPSTCRCRTAARGAVRARRPGRSRRRTACPG